MSGAFDRHPDRRRVDPDGAGTFDSEPPQHLPQECVRAWRYLVARLPLIAITKTDELVVEITARLLAQYWISGSLDVLKELRAWLGKLGFSPADRTRFAAPKGPNPFERFRP